MSSQTNRFGRPDETRTSWNRCRVVLLIFENKSQDQIFKSGAAPYLTTLSQQCGRGTNMNTPDPLTSLGNYIALTSGFTGHPVHITPNKSHIMHEDDAPGTTTQTQRMQAGDAWAAGYLPKVFASPQYRAGRTVVIVTFDE